MALAGKFLNLDGKLSPKTFLGCFTFNLQFLPQPPITFNHHLINAASSPIIVYINPCVTLNKSVLNWTQICQLHWKIQLYEKSLYKYCHGVHWFFSVSPFIIKNNLIKKLFFNFWQIFTNLSSLFEKKITTGSVLNTFYLSTWVKGHLHV